MGKMITVRMLVLISLSMYLFGIIAIICDSYPLFNGKADYAIVFGNKVYENGKPSVRLQKRLDAGIFLLKEHKVNKLMVSGGLGKEGHDEALVMAKYLIKKG